MQAERMLSNGTDGEEWFKFDMKVIINC
jgi:hypothetical protein